MKKPENLLTIPGIKSFCLGIVVSAALFLPSQASADDISLNLKNVTVKRAIAALQQSHYSLTVDASQIDMERRITVAAEDEPIENVLAQIFAGQDVAALSAKDLRAARKKIGMIFQHFNLMPSRTVAGNVAYPLKGSGLSKEDIQKKVATLLELVGIGDKADAYPSQLSGGQKQRVAIARALANDPQVLLCDEATSALDPQTTKAILHLLKHLNETLGITIVLITHEMAVVKEICDRVAVMEYGRVVEQGEVFTVFAEPKQDITKSFIHTTSNLQKVEALIAEDSPVTRLQPGELIVRLSYVQRNVNEPIISAVSQMFNVSLNIIFADITIVQDSPIGGTVAIISGERKQITKAIEYLIEKNVGVEVIKDARADR